VDPSKIVPQGKFGVLHDIFDHAVLGHSFNRAGEVRAFGAMFFRQAISGGDYHTYARELAGVIGGDIWNWQEDETYTEQPYVSGYASEQFKLLSWDLLSGLGWPANLSPSACHMYLCQGYGRASTWWYGDQYSAVDRTRGMMDLIPDPYMHNNGTRLLVRLDGGALRNLSVDVQVPEVASPGTAS
jgi:hypothetical protein